MSASSRGVSASASYILSSTIKGGTSIGGTVRCRIGFTAFMAWMGIVLQRDTALEIQDSGAVNTATFEAIGGSCHGLGKVTKDSSFQTRVTENRISVIEMVLDEVEGWMARSDRSQKIGFLGGANQNVVGSSKLGCNPMRHNTSCLPSI